MVLIHDIFMCVILQIFYGNLDGEAVVTSVFLKPIYTRMIRITCITRHGDKWQLRFEILGCKL